MVRVRGDHPKPYCGCPVPRANLTRRLLRNEWIETDSDGRSRYGTGPDADRVEAKQSSGSSGCSTRPTTVRCLSRRRIRPSEHIQRRAYGQDTADFLPTEGIVSFTELFRDLQLI